MITLGAQEASHRDAEGDNWCGMDPPVAISSAPPWTKSDVERSVVNQSPSRDYLCQRASLVNKPHFQLHLSPMRPAAQAVQNLSAAR